MLSVVHVASALVGIVLGIVALRSPNGTPARRAFGEGYLLAWAGTGASAIVLGAGSPGADPYEALTAVGLVLVALAYGTLLFRDQIGLAWPRYHDALVAASLAALAVTAANGVLVLTVGDYSNWLFWVLVLHPFTWTSALHRLLAKRYGSASPGRPDDSRPKPTPPAFAVHPQTCGLVNTRSPEWARVLRAHPPPYLMGVVPGGGALGYALYSLPAERLLVARAVDHLDDVLDRVRAMARTPSVPRALSDGVWELRDVAGVVVCDAYGKARESAPEGEGTASAFQTWTVLHIAESLGVPTRTVTADQWGRWWDVVTLAERTGYRVGGDLETARLAVGAGRLVYGLTYGDFSRGR